MRRIPPRTPEQQAFINGLSNHKRTIWARAGYPIKMIDKWMDEHIKAAPGNWIDSPQVEKEKSQ